MTTVPPQDSQNPTDRELAGLAEQAGQPPSAYVGLLTGGFDRPYVYGIAMALASKGVRLEIVGSDAVYRPELDVRPRLTFLNLRGDQSPNVELQKKILRLLIYYTRLIRYAWTAKPRLFHILWDNKFLVFDRTFLMLYYKLLGKTLAFTAMNVNAGRRDANDSILNRLSLRIQYGLADHIFVHTEKMKQDLIKGFGVQERSITIAPMGINDSVPITDLTSAQARAKLGIGCHEKTILFFGTIRPYKGLEYLVTAFQEIAGESSDYRLLIVGDPMNSGQYWQEIQEAIEKDPSRDRVIRRIEFIADSETEIYFKAADVSVLPYNDIFQSGVLVLAYSFGLPVIATDVGSLRQDIAEGKTGFICRPRDPVDIARAIKVFFESDLYKQREENRQTIREYARKNHSWDAAGEITSNVYTRLLRKRP